MRSETSAAVRHTALAETDRFGAWVAAIESVSKNSFGAAEAIARNHATRVCQAFDICPPRNLISGWHPALPPPEKASAKLAQTPRKNLPDEDWEERRTFCRSPPRTFRLHNKIQ